MTEAMQSHWLQSEKWKNWFYGGSARFARDRGALPDTTNIDNPLTDAGYVELLEQFTSEGCHLAEYDTPDKAVDAWKGWVKTLSAIKPAQTVELTCSISKTFGGVTVTFGYTGTFEVNERQLKSAYQYCVEAVEAQFSRHVQHNLPSTSAPAMAPSDNSIKSETFVSTHILKENNGGNDMYKMVGGKYSKYGVRIWPEVLQASGVNLDALDYGKTGMVRECVAIFDSNKHGKVIKLS